MRKYLLLLPFFLSFFIINNSFAVSDYTIHLESITSGWSLLPDCNYQCQHQYNYMIVEYTPAVNNNLFSFKATYTIDGLSMSNLITYQAAPVGYAVYNISLADSRFMADSSFSPNGGIDITLTESIEQSCPDPEPCPVVPETPYAEKFDNIEKAIYVCGAILIMLYFFYCIYRMIIKGSGVN